MSSPDPYPPVAASGTGADLGRIGFVIAIVAVALAVIQQLTFAFFPTIQYQLGLSISAIGVFAGGFSIIHGIVSAVALVLGIAGAQRRRSPIHSGIAIGVGGAGVVATIVAIALVPLVGLLL